MIHELKTLPEYFDAVVSGNKTFEVRKNDRDFRKGDFLALNEFSDKKIRYTGRSCLVRITYILDTPNYCKDEFVILGIETCGIRARSISEYGYCSSVVPVYGESEVIE